jgi:hypothetical protein
MKNPKNSFSEYQIEYCKELLNFQKKQWVSEVENHANILYKHFRCMQKLEDAKIDILNSFNIKEKLTDAWIYFGGRWSPECDGILYNSESYHNNYINHTISHFLKEDLENKYLYGMEALDGLQAAHGNFDSLWTNFFTDKKEIEFYKSFFTLTENQKGVLDFYELCRAASPQELSEILDDELSMITRKTISKELDLISDLNPIYVEYQKYFIKFVYLCLSLRDSEIAIESALLNTQLTENIKNYDPKYQQLSEIFHARDLNPWWWQNDPFGDNYCNYEEIILSRFDHIIKELEVKNDSKSIIQLKYIQFNTKLDAVFKYY